MFHSFGWLQETVEHILITDGELEEAAPEQAEEEPQGADGEMGDEA